MKQTDINKMRHSMAHIMAYAIESIHPGVKFGVGPVIENGFYYDVLTKKPLSLEDLSAIEKEMHHIIDQDLQFDCEHMDIDKATDYFDRSGQDFKVELLKDIKSKGTTKLGEINPADVGVEQSSKSIDRVTIYKTGKFADLCRGPHLESTGQAGVFQLTKIAGAYWRGDNTKPQMQRIYGVAFTTDEELKHYLWQQVEATKRDHRKLGKELDLFVFSDLVGAGLPLWTPKGTIIRQQLDDFITELRRPYDYQSVAIPHITKKDLYEKSGHWHKFKDELFRIKSREGHDFAIKPMNCPHHAQIFATQPRSYRELPIRYSETTMVYRDEQSGELHGLERVRGGITQDDAHVFCRLDQVEQEILNIWSIIEKFYQTLGIDLKVRLSRRGQADKATYGGDERLWSKAEMILEQIVKAKLGNDYIDGAGEAAFYGPKLDFIGRDSLGRQLQVGTIQLDFSQPESFNLTCINEKGESERVVMIHCAIAGSLERCIALLLEHFAGVFPVWLAPVQVVIIPISEKYTDYGEQVKKELKQAGVRVGLDDSDESLGKRIRAMEMQKIPYLLVVGDKEKAVGKVAVRKSGQGDLGTQSLEQFLQTITDQIEKRAL